MLFTLSFLSCDLPETSKLGQCTKLERGVVPGYMVVYMLLGPLVLHHIHVRFVDGIAGERNNTAFVSTN
jgi:hypothetical protein